MQKEITVPWAKMGWASNKPDCQRYDVDEAVDLEGANEEHPEVLEHLREEVPGAMERGT